MKRLLDLFSGPRKSVSSIAKQLGYTTLSVDINEKFNPDIVHDILTWNYKKYPPGYFKVITASPPCTEFSRAKTVGVRKLRYALKLVKKTLEIIEYFKPKYFVIENPVGMLRHQKIMEHLSKFRNTVSYCKYGYNYRKDTDIWTNINANFLICRKGSYCSYKATNGSHSHTVQSGPRTLSNLTQIHTPDLGQRYSLPKKLVFDLLTSCF